MYGGVYYWHLLWSVYQLYTKFLFIYAKLEISNPKIIKKGFDFSSKDKIREINLYLLYVDQSNPKKIVLSQVHYRYIVTVTKLRSDDSLSESLLRAYLYAL
jgi:hypothetical protein